MYTTAEHRYVESFHFFQVQLFILCKRKKCLVKVLTFSQKLTFCVATKQLVNF